MSSDFISLAVTVISAVTDLVMLVLAICAYRKYCIDDKIKDENVKAIIKVIENFQGLEFFVHGEQYLLCVRLKDAFFSNRYSEYDEIKVVFTREAFSRLAIFVSSSQSPFLPRGVADMLSKIDPVLGEVVEGKNDYAVIDVGVKERNSMILRIDQKDVCLRDFLRMFYDLRNSIVGWMKENATKVDINF